MNTLVRGQKLPIFSGPGLPALELAARIVEWARAPKGEPFAVVFVGIGITARESSEFLERFESQRRPGAHAWCSSTRPGIPTIERLLAPRVALAEAEFLAYEHGLHVLVVMADVTSYCEALRELATARQEIPGRRGYPGYMYTDLASLFERAGLVRGRTGSVTQLPVLTMPDDDLTHPIPDLTGYITEGQVVLGRDLHRRGVFPPIDVLPSLSRLMNAGIGQGRSAARAPRVGGPALCAVRPGHRGAADGHHRRRERAAPGGPPRARLRGPLRAHPRGPGTGAAHPVRDARGGLVADGGLSPRGPGAHPRGHLGAALRRTGASR